MVFSGAWVEAPRCATTNVMRLILLVLRLALRHAAQDPDPDQQQHEQRRDRHTVRVAVQAGEQARHDDAVDERADDGAELPDQAVEAEHLAHPVGRRQAQEHEPIDHADTAEPGTQQRAGDQERDRSPGIR